MPTAADTDHTPHPINNSPSSLGWLGRENPIGRQFDFLLYMLPKLMYTTTSILPGRYQQQRQLRARCASLTDFTVSIGR